MTTFKFADRESFLAKNIRIESMHHPTDYTVFINDLFITLNILGDCFFLHIDETCDFLAITDPSTGNEIVKYFNLFNHKILTNKEPDSIYVTNKEVVC